MRLVSDAALPRFGIDFDDQIKVMMLGRPFAELQHFGKLVGSVDMQNRKRYASGKGFAGEPNENIGIFSHRPRHGDIFESVIRLPKNKNALVLELIEMCAAQFSHEIVLLESITKLATDEHRFTQIHLVEVFFS